jgi:hypothetical protein
MNLDLFLVQKVVQSLFTNDANTTLMPLQTSPKNENKEREGNGKENDKDKRKLIEVYSMLYDKMNAANLYVNTQKNSGCFECQEIAVDITSQIPRPKSFSSAYITPEISQYITNEAKKILTFECRIKTRLIRLHFVIFKNNPNIVDLISHYKVLAHRVYMWLSMISDKSKCIETLNIYIYLTPFEKKYPQLKETQLVLNMQIQDTHSDAIKKMKLSSTDKKNGSKCLCTKQCTHLGRILTVTLKQMMIDI